MNRLLIIYLDESQSISLTENTREQRLYSFVAVRYTNKVCKRMSVAVHAEKTMSSGSELIVLSCVYKPTKSFKAKNHRF